jgi:hypothetical protein
MATNSNAAPPNIANLFGSGTSGPSDAPTTSTITPAPATGPQGPNSANLNPGAGADAYALNPTIANKPLPGAGNTGVVQGQAAEPLNETTVVKNLAEALGIKAKPGQQLEVAVALNLADKYGVKVNTEVDTWRGTGQHQGTIGGLRHDIASWYKDVSRGLGSGTQQLMLHTGVGSQDQTNATEFNGGVSPEVEQQYESAIKIKNPALRAKALQAVNKQTPLSKIKEDLKQQQTDNAPAPKPEQVESTKALNQIVTQVASELGIQNAGPNAITDIAEAEGVPTATTAVAGNSGTPQTAGQAMSFFSQLLGDPTAKITVDGKTMTGSQYLASQVTSFTNAGLLDNNQNGAKQKNGTQYTNTQLAGAYQQVLSQQVQNNQSQAQALASLQTNNQSPGQPTSEMFAFVQGVAQEFGVGLTPDQVTQIADTYGPTAAVSSSASGGAARDPSSVEDEIKDAVVALYSPPSDPNDPNSVNAYGVANPSGVANTMYVDIQQAALKYAIPETPAQIQAMVKNALQGATVESMYVAADAAEAQATETFQQQAAGMYPALSAQIGQGATVQDLTAPYFNVAEAYTGVPASTMTADQATGGVSKWGNFLQGANDPKTGTPTLMTLDQWKQTLMQDQQYGFQNTQGAKDMAEQFTSAILNEFGKVNTNGGSSEPFQQFNPSSALEANSASGGSAPT